MAERHLRLVVAKQAVREIEERTGDAAGKRAGVVDDKRVGRETERRVDRKVDRKGDHKDVRQTTAIEFAIAVVSSRSLPEKKLRERLAPRFDADEVDATMTRMRELRLVDDAAWAERYARDRFERLGKGRHRIRNELISKGIDRAAVDSALALVLGGTERGTQRGTERGADGLAQGGDIEREKAAAMLETMRIKLARGVAGSEEGVKIRLFRRMLARGYPASLVRDLLDVS